MSTELDKLRQSALAPAEEASRPPVPYAGEAFNSFFTFRYSRTEVSTQGGRLNVKMKETRFQDGKLTLEECEGSLDREAYDAVVREAQTQFFNQVGSLMRMFYLPFGGRGRNDE